LTPGCSTCAYAIEWIRSSYVGTWRLFRDHPEIETPGRYVFLPDGSPHYQGVHHLGAPSWNKGEPEFLSDLLGQASYDGWDNGGSTIAPPRAVLIGSANCVQNGASYPPVVPGRVLEGGWDSRCFLPGPLPAILAVDIKPRANQAIYAAVLDALYTDPVAAAALLQAFLGPNAVLTTVPNSSSYLPGSIVAVTPEYSVIVISGSTTPQQRALQALYAGGGPINEGNFATNPVWYAASVEMGIRLNLAGADPSKPVIIVGHSYGGAAGSVLAARLMNQTPGRDVRLLTFGAPKPGDARLANLLRLARQIHIANVGDPVPLLPPNASELWAFWGIAPPDFIAAWLSWSDPGSQLYLRSDGGENESPSGFLPYDLLAPILNDAVLGLPFAPFADHDIKEYLRRLLL
jgi:hypothetical protein